MNGKLHYTSIFKQEGTSQAERFSEDLNPGNLKIDDRKLEDFIGFARNFSKNIRFIDMNSSDLKDSWELFFQNKDDAILLTARIAAKKTEEIKLGFEFLKNKFEDQGTTESFAEVVNYIGSQFARLNRWYLAGSPDNSWHDIIKTEIRSNLQKPLTNFYEIISRVDELKGKEAGVTNVRRDIKEGDIWGDFTGGDKAYGQQVFIGNNDDEKLTNAFYYLSEIFETVYYVIQRIVDKSNDYLKNYFQEQTTDIHNHEAHIALLLAFIKLFEYVQEEINSIPGRHLDYYYKDILQVKTKEAVPDQAFVCFELAKDFSEYVLKAGTELSAGKDGKKVEQVYKLDKDITVRNAKVDTVKTVYLDKDSNNQVLMYSSDILKLEGSARTSPDGGFWNLFGKHTCRTQAKIGFAIASTQFYLSKGERFVTIAFDLKEDVPIDKFDPAIVMDILSISLTGEAGWMDIPNFMDEKITTVVDGKTTPVINKKTTTTLEKTGSRKVELKFKIPIGIESAVIAFDKKIHGEDYSKRIPVLQCFLNYPAVPGQDDLYQEKIKHLNVIQNLKIVNASIKVQIGDVDAKISFNGIRDLVLQNHESLLDIKKPFYPFTPVPKVGSSFYISCKDFLYKEIQELSINIEWMLPDKFSEYYSAYPPPYSSNKFTVSLSILQKSQWKKIRDFQLIDSESTDPRFKSVKILFDKVKLTDEVIQKGGDLSKFDISKWDGTLKIKLNYPDFGHGIYTQLITSTSLERSSSKHQVDYYEKVKDELHDSVVTIKLPKDLEKENGFLKVVFDILRNFGQSDQEKAKTMMIRDLREKITKYNEIDLVRKTGSEQKGEVIVNDNNFIQSIFRFLKKINLLDKDVYYDRNKDNLEDVAKSISEEVNSAADFLLPSENELINIIYDEAINIIDRTVLKSVAEIMALDAAKWDGKTIAKIIEDDFDEANEVINDIIAKNIAKKYIARNIPGVPYAPLINTIAASYKSEKACDADHDHFFHITPLGVEEVDPERIVTVGAHIFPRTIVLDDRNNYDPEGLLFIGLGNIKSGHDIPLLFQMMEGSNPSEKIPPLVNWWYRDADQWFQFPNENILLDNTRGLQKSGIIKFLIPQLMEVVNNSFDKHGLFWLCGTVNKNAEAFPAVVDIVSNCAIVSFSYQGNDPDHYKLQLPAKKITKFLVNETPVKKIYQPLPSFGGKMKEEGKVYYTRVSERLRHKSRAINNWDYERLVLEHYNFVYKVKCINNYYKGKHLKGHVTIVPLSDLHNNEKADTNSLIPKISYVDLKDIEVYLTSLSSPFIKVHVINPQIEYVLITVNVKFKDRSDRGLYMQQLNKDLISYLTPWSSGDREALKFSSKTYSSSVINYIGNLKYVDYITDFVMEQYRVDENGMKKFVQTENQSVSLSETIVSTEHSILMSAPKHVIELID